MSINNADYARSYSNQNLGGISGNKDDDGDDKGISAGKMLGWFNDSYRGQESWRRKTVESLKMLNNDQWPEELLAQMPPNMAPIVINLMLAPILYISGVQRQTRQDAKIVSATGANPRMAELMNELVHWIETQNRSDEIDSQVFLDKIAVGMGWWKEVIEYDCEDLEGQITILRRPTLAVFPDPNWFDVRRWKDAAYVFDTEFMTIDEACEKWPDHKEKFKSATGEWLRTTRTSSGSTLGVVGEDAGDSFALDRLWWDDKTKRIRICECWYKDTKKIDIALNLAQPDAPIFEADKVKIVKEELKKNPQLAQQWTVFKKPMTLVRVAHLFHDTKLDDDPSPHTENPEDFPMFPSMAYYFWNEPYGMAELMKDPQREKNKRRSKLIELIGRMPLSGFLNKEADGADQRQIEEYGAGNGVVINYKQVKPDQIEPPPLPMALIELENRAEKEIKEITNVHDELLGQATQKTISGAAIEARQRGGFLSHEILFDTFRLEKELRVRFLIGMVKEYMSPTKALRILGTLAGRGNQQLDVMLGAAAENPIAAEEVMQLLSDAFNEDYDVVISSKPTEPSLAMDAWNTLSELKQAGAEIPPKTLWEAAQKAGVLNEGQVQEILGFIQQTQQQQMGAGQGAPGQPGAPAIPGPGGPPPAPGGPPPPPA
jgi:hypothetical protein